MTTRLPLAKTYSLVEYAAPPSPPQDSLGLPPDWQSFEQFFQVNRPAFENLANQWQVCAEELALTFYGLKLAPFVSHLDQRHLAKSLEQAGLLR